MAGARFHAKYSGSNAHRFMACAAQVSFCAPIPEQETEHSREGTFAHAVLEAAIKSKLLHAGPMIGVVEIGARYVDEDTADAVQHVLDYVARLRGEMPDLVVHSESASNFPGYKFSFASGSADVSWFSIAARRSGVIDYKHGAGERVDVHDNAQISWYLWSEYAFLNPQYSFTGTIIQPRHWAYQGPREQNFLWADLFDFSRDVAAAISAAEKPGAVFTAGPHCYRCPGAAQCLALEQKVKGYLSGSATPDTGRLAEIVASADLARKWLKACEDAAFSQARQGVHVPGYKLVKGDSQRRWRPDRTPEQLAEEVIRMTHGKLQAGDVSKKKLLSLTELEKKVVQCFRDTAAPGQADKAAAAARAAFAFLTLKDTGANLSLVPESDPRPAYTGSAADDFADVVIQTQ